MSEQLIISVSREYGSGGHEIAQKLAEYYKLPMYDHNLLDEVAASDKTYILVAHNGIARVVQSYFYEMTNEEYALAGIRNCELVEYHFD